MSCSKQTSTRGEPLATSTASARSSDAQARMAMRYQLDGLVGQDQEDVVGPRARRAAAPGPAPA